jgi:uncharacterized membrane protein YkoI
MPGAELAAYMAALARLLGSREYVHFVAIRDESTGIEAHIGIKARHMVRQRMRDVDSASSPVELRRQRDEINDMLAHRKTSAKLQEIRHNGSKINRVEFQGAESSKPELPSIRDHVQVQGTLYRIEGRDETVHAGIVDGETRYSTVISRDQAKEIARESMFGMVRIEGSALLTRLPNGTWEIGEIEATNIEPLVETSLAETLGELQAAGGFGWSDDPAGLAALDEMRSPE